MKALKLIDLDAIEKLIENPYSDQELRERHILGPNPIKKLISKPTYHLLAGKYECYTRSNTIQIRPLPQFIFVAEN